jgi:hypothetical protein
LNQTETSAKDAQTVKLVRVSGPELGVLLRGLARPLFLAALLASAAPADSNGAAGKATPAPSSVAKPPIPNATPAPSAKSTQAKSEKRKSDAAASGSNKSDPASKGTSVDKPKTKAVPPFRNSEASTKKTPQVAPSDPSSPAVEKAKPAIEEQPATPPPAGGFVISVKDAAPGDPLPTPAAEETKSDPSNAAPPSLDVLLPLFPPGQIQPIQLFPPPFSPGGTPLLFPPSPDQPAPPPPASPEEHRYRVSKITYQFGAPGSKPNKKLPPIEKITQGKVTLGRSKDGLTAPTRGEKKEEVAVVGGKSQYYYGDALLALYNGVVESLNKSYGIYGVYVFADQDQIDPVTLEDKRGGKSGELTVRVYVSEVKEVRTIARKVPFGAGDQPKINDPKHERIRSKSPIFATSELNGGGFIEKVRLQSYLDRVNRFRGRRVDAAVEASGEQGKVILDYMVREQKQFSVYAQTNNTGTEETGEWRTRLGAEYRQLLGLDDTLRLEYATSNFKDYQAGYFSYEFTPVFPDYLKLRAYGNWGRYSSSDVGLGLVNFSGESFTGGAALTWTPAYIKGFPLDIYGGAEWLNASVNNSTVGGGSTDFFLPYVGIGTDKTTDKFTLAVNAEAQMNMPGVAGTDSGIDLDILGRSDTDNDFIIGKWNLLFSFYLEPIIFGKQWDQQETWWKSTRAHELSFSFRGQVAFDKARLAPQLQYVAGGLYTVRGYPESYTAGDTAMVGSFEYRFHIPRAFKPANQPKVKKKKAGDTAEPAEIPPVDAAKAHGFAFRPSGISTGPDWDLIFRYFLDYGQTLNNYPFPYESSRQLLGTGVGLELQIFKPLFASARVDWGYALLGVDDPSVKRVDQGDSRLNVSFSIAW